MSATRSGEGREAGKAADARDSSRDPLDFTGQVAVVTGGSRGVGRAIAEAYLRAGADVLVCGRNEPATERLPSASDRRAVFFKADVRDAEKAAAVVRNAVERFGHLDVLVNNAGGSPSVPSAEASPRFVSSVVALNLLAPFYCAQAAYAVMQAQEAGGCVINIASVSGLRPSPGSAAYAAAKAGLINLTRTLAVEWAPKVRVNCVVGGLLATESADEHYGGEAGLRAVAATVPLKRMGTPADVAGICLFLSSPLSAYVTGAAIEAHGGGEWPAYLTALERERK
ncbi:MAG TPA: SDR family oxidoreductase [Acidimicrobiales bacterium]|nr:SDR family oxidoreductase [Acidimicrobiales bacterium]